MVPNKDGQDKSVGQVTTVARHFELGSVALAVIKRGTDPLADLLVRTAGCDIPARQVVIVPPDAGASATVPRLPRREAMPRGIILIASFIVDCDHGPGDEDFANAGRDKHIAQLEAVVIGRIRELNSEKTRIRTVLPVDGCK